MPDKAATTRAETASRIRIVGLLLVALAAFALWVAMVDREESPVADAVLTPEADLDRAVTEVDDAPVAELPFSESKSLRVQGEIVDSPCESGICGRVVDEQGVGVADVQMHLTPNWRRKDSSLGYTEFSSDEQLDAQVKRALLASTEDEQETSTDADGFFHFDDLEKMAWRIVAEHPLYRVRSEERSSGLSVGNQVNFLASRRTDVEVKVYGPDGELVEGAIIRETGDHSLKSVDHDWASAVPRLHLDPGTYTLSAYSNESRIPLRAVYRSEPQEVTLARGEQGRALRFDLFRRSAIGGRVLAAPGDEVPAGLTVHLLPIAAGQEVDLSQLGAANQSSRYQEDRHHGWRTQPTSEVSRHKSGARASLDEQQRFIFQDLEPGHYVVGASRNWINEASVHKVVELSDSRVLHDLVLPPIERARRLHVSVFTPDGNVLKGASFDLRYSLGAEHRFLGLNSMKDTGGTYLLRFPEAIETEYFDRADADALFDLDITHPKYCASRVELRPGQTAISATLDEPARLIVTVTGSDDPSLLERVLLDVKQLPSEHSPWSAPSRAERPTRKGKTWTFARLEPGRCRVTLSLRRPRISSDLEAPSSLGARELSLRAGANSLEFQFDILEDKLPRGHFVLPTH